MNMVFFSTHTYTLLTHMDAIQNIQTCAYLCQLTHARAYIVREQSESTDCRGGARDDPEHRSHTN